MSPGRARVLALGIGLAVSSAHAHPMGNASINHYAGLELGPRSVRVKYLLDFAEIPSVRELERVDMDRDDRVTGPEREAYLEILESEVLPRLSLKVNGRPLSLEPDWGRVTFPMGEGGMSTVRVAWELVAVLDSLPARNFLVWNDSNFAEFEGWKEIRFRGLEGIGVGRTSLRPGPTSRELEEYPEELPERPPVDTKAWCLFGPGMEAPSPEPEAEGDDARGAIGGEGDRRAPGLLIALAGLLVAAAWLGRRRR